VTPPNATEADELEVTVDVTNEGARAEEETVFLFVRDRVASVARPTLELKGVTKVMLEPGEIEIHVGPCADAAQLLTAHLTLRA
jgi:beta-glucosidase